MPPLCALTEGELADNAVIRDRCASSKAFVVALRFFVRLSAGGPPASDFMMIHEIDFYRAAA